jgi:hypothetical protein
MIGGRAALKMSSTNRRQIAVGTPGSRPFLTPQFPPTEISNKVTPVPRCTMVELLGLLQSVRS